MFKKTIVLLSLLVILCISWFWLGKRSEMGTAELIELSRSNPKAFNEYVQSRINVAEVSRKQSVPIEGTQPTPMTPEDLMKLSQADPQAVSKFLESRIQQPQHNTAEKLLNYLAHGKYE